MGALGVVRVRLTKRLAQKIDGVDLSANAVGDVLELKAKDASLLVAEGWAIPERRARSRENDGQSVASDSHRRKGGGKQRPR